MIEVMLQAHRLLTLGMVEQAEALYRRVADQDPHNAIAVVGLAECAIERGDDHAAYAHAVRALEIDPLNNVALRLEARTSEILAARGDPVRRPEMVTSPRAAEPRKSGLLGRILGR